MFTLTQEEKNALLNSADPAVVAATKKLITAEETGEFVPKSRLSKEIKEAEEIKNKLAAIEEANRKEEEERARKNGEFEKLLNDEKTAHQKTQAERDAEKKIADEYRKLHKEAIESYKKLLGDKWDDSMSTLPLEALAKIAGQTNPIPGVITAQGKPPEVTPEKQKLEEKLVAAQKAGRLAEVVSIRNQLTQLQST